MKRPVILLLGKLPPPFMGPAIATRILLDSSLKEHYRIIHLDTRAHRSLGTMGKWSVGKVLRTLTIYSRMKLLILRYRPKVCIIPVSQSTTGFLKDSVTSEEKKVLLKAIEDFRRELVSGSVPLSLIDLANARADNAYLAGQVLLKPQ